MNFSEMIDRERVLDRIRYLYKTTYTNMEFDNAIWSAMDNPTSEEVEVTGTCDQGKFSFPLSYQAIVEYSTKQEEEEAKEFLPSKVSISSTIEKHLHARLIELCVYRIGEDEFDTLKNYHPSDIFYDVSLEYSGDDILAHTVALSKDGSQVFAEHDYLYSPRDIIKILIKEAFE